MLIRIFVLLVFALFLISFDVVLEHAMSILKISLQLLLLLLLEIMFA